MTDKHAIQDVLSQYVRATDERDGDAQAKLFADNGMIRFFGRSGTEEYQLAGEPFIGAERIRRHMEGFPPRPERTYQHHITTDHLIRVNGAEATMNAQFLVFSSVAAPKPEDGWQAPPGVKGDITLIMIGYYDSDLRKIDGVWKLTRLDVKHSLPVFMGHEKSDAEQDELRLQIVGLKP
jgi:hypothetical protein